MRSRIPACCSVVVLLAVWSVHAEAAGNFVTIDPAHGFNTSASVINDAGDIAGSYYDRENAIHGFVRFADGSFAIIRRDKSNILLPYVINSTDMVAGFFDKPGSDNYGFVWTVDGTITRVAVPGDVEATDIFGINDAGATTGNFYPTQSGAQGFVRSMDGTFVTFRADPNAYETNADCINGKGTVAGSYMLNGDSIPHFYLRSATGGITTYDVPGSEVQGFVTGLNIHGAVVGWHTDDQDQTHAFVRTVDGTVTSFDAPTAAFGTSASGINAKGYVTGSYYTSDYVGHGFLRAPDGTMTSLDYPGAKSTYPSAINDKGEIVGSYQDSTGVMHGFYFKK